MSHRGNPFEGADRSPSLGQWPAEAYEEEGRVKKSGIHKPGEYERAAQSEDELIELIDNEPVLKEEGHEYPASDRWDPVLGALDELNDEDVARAEEQEKRAKKYAEQVELKSAGDVPLKDVSTGTLHMSARDTLSAKERADRDIGKDNKVLRRYKKRNDSQARVGIEHQLRQAKKDSVERRTAV